MRMLFVLLMLAAVTAAAGDLLAAKRYNIVDLGVDGESIAHVGINDDGDVVIGLNLQDNAATNRVLFLSNSVVKELPTLGGRLHGFSTPNQHGVIVGGSETPDGLRHAVIYKNNQLFDWGSLGELGSSLVDINESGTIIGNIWNRSSTTGVIYNGPNDVTYLGALGGDVSSVSDINNLGQITGISVSSTSWESYIYKNGQMSSIGSLGGHITYAYSINDLGEIVGESSLANREMHAFLWDEVHGIRDLGITGINSIATKINNQGTIVGEVEIESARFAAAFGAAGEYALLQDLIPPNNGWDRLTFVDDINNLGQIVGIGIYQGRNRAFLLNPVPEPFATWFFLAVSCVVLTVRHHGRDHRRWP